MEFLRNDAVYEVVYSKQDAIKELKKDSRIKSIFLNPRGHIIIITKPIIPYSTDITFLVPIGIYKIKLFIHRDGNLITRIKRIGGGITDYGIHTPHIRDSFDEDDKICWGSECETVDKIYEKRDWFWLGKKCLDLLEDGEVAEDEDNFGGFFYSLQIKYANEMKLRRKKQLVDILKQKINNLDEDELAHHKNTLCNPTYKVLTKEAQNGIKNKRTSKKKIKSIQSNIRQHRNRRIFNRRKKTRRHNN